MKKIYEVDWQMELHCEFEVDLDKIDEKILKDQNEYWSGSEKRLEQCPDLLHLVLKMLAKMVFMLSAEGYNVNGIIQDMSAEPGYIPLDGSKGIRLLGVDELSFNFDELSVKEIEL